MLRRLARLFASLFGYGAALRKPVVEEIEPRILYSADANPLLWGAPDAQPTAVVAGVDAGQSASAAQAVGAPQQQERRREIVFVDAAVQDAQVLIDAVLAARPTGTVIEVVQLSGGADGLQQIGDVLAAERGIDAIHIVSHGGPGQLQLGNISLDAAGLQSRAAELQGWRAALSADADLMLYGCDVAQGDGGQAFVSDLARLTGADVAASSDLTGSAQRGGDWVLEYEVGRVEAAPVVGANSAQAWSHVLAVGVDATTTGTTTGSSLTISHTTSGTNRLMLVGVSVREIGSESVSSMTYNGSSLTFTGAVQAADGARVEIWSLVAPSVGTSDLVVNLTGAGGGTNVAVMTFTGVDQGTPLGAFASAFGDANNGSVAVGSATGELVFGVVAVKDNNQDLAPGPGQTERWDLFTGTEANGGGSTEAGAASVAMSWSWSSGTDWAIGGVSIKPALISVTPAAGLTTTEAGGSASFDVVLTSAPTATVTIPVSSSDTSEGTVSTTSLTFTTANWSTPQTITVTGVDDALADGYQPYTIVLGPATSSDLNYNNVNPSDVQIANADNDINYNLITVTTTSDLSDGDTSSLAALAANRGADGFISLREAIIAANSTANGVGGADRIHFNIAGAGTHVINLGSALPTITQAVVIDGSTEPDFAGSPIVRIDGASAGAGVSGISIAAGGAGSTIRGLMITRFAADGVNVASGANGVTIAGNWIGTTGTGSTGVGNGDDGIDIAGSSAIIGGTGANDRNVITNSGDEGINIAGSGVTAHLIQGNYIGVDPDGASGNGNTDVGIAIISGSGNTIGGTSAAARNVISRNWEGIEINTADNVVQGNYIGSDASGTLNRGNRLGDGIQIQGSAANTVVGGTAGGAGNLIAFNAGDGVSLLAGSGHLLLGNQIHSNAANGIDLANDGITGNDAGDGDGGVNLLQNFPTLGTVNSNAAGTTINVLALNSTANTSFRVEFFANRPSVADAPNGEGERYLGFVNVTTDNLGVVTVASTTLADVWVNSGDRITATATNLTTNNTSEFAANVTATSTGIVVVDTTSDVSDGTTTSITNLGNARGADGRISLREAIIAANNTANGGTPDKIVFNIPLNDASHVYYRNNGVAGTFAAPVATTLADAAISDFDSDYLAGTARSWFRITLGASDLNVTQAVIIDGSTQAGYDAAKGPIIEIDANGVTAGDPNALTLTTGGSTVRGLVIHSADDNAIEVDVNADGSVIVGNYLGTDVSGTKALGNSSDGPYGALGIKADGVIVGGTTVSDRNLFSGNLGYGIEIYSSATGAVIRGNTIGTTADGSAALGNAAGGIYIWNGAANNTIGGATANEGNRIASNGGDGVWVGATAGAGNAILGNAIYSNTGLAIDLGANGVTVNDTNDGDSGANDLLNFPIVTNVVQNGANLDVTLVLDVPAGNYRIELYQNPAGIDSTRYGEGQVFLGALSVTSTGSGAQTLTGTLNNVTATSITRISATATRDLGAGTYRSTSEFGPRAGLVVSTTADAMDGTTTSVAALISNPGADGQISLREAITAANATAGTDYIYFDITAALAGGVHTITLAYDGPDAGTTPDPLPTITSPVVINGWTEPDYAGGPIIELNGNNVGSLVKGLTLGAGSDGSTIRGLIINRFTGTGIEITGSNNHTIQGNWIGLDSTGTAAAGNGVKGIYALNSTGLLIGGTTAAERNVVSGNVQQGIYFDNVDNSTISGNYVGTNVAGTGDVNGSTANTAQSGVFLTNGSSGNVIGGLSDGARNVLSGNNHFGFEVLFGSQNNLLQGNYIGTDATGLVALGNINGGAVFWGAGSGNVFGGSAPGARNVIAGNTYNGVVVGSASTGATIQGNYIGVGADGVTVLGNGSSGVSVEGGSTGTRIGTNADGSNDAAEGNVISGNTYGVRVSDSGTDGTVVAGNLIGLAADGNTLAGNSSHGVSVVSGAGSVTIGGATSASRNVISGNASFGVYFGSTAAGSSVLNNYIGTNAAGNAARANLDGVWIDGSANHTIGQVGAGNLISGNTYYGVTIDGAAATGNVIRANLIGTDAAGTGDLGNGAQGILVSNGASSTAIGGITAGQGNTIAFNDGDGIFVSAGTGISMLGNSIHSNTDQGIDLGTNGVTANDGDDVDSGANTLQNFPRLTLARTNGSNQLTLNGTLDSTINTWFRIEFFANTAQDGSGYGEGQTYLGSALVQTDGNGDATIATTLAVNVAAGSFISATATQTNAGETLHTNTSEFARNIYALPLVQGALVVDTTNDMLDGDATSISTLLANKGADGFISLREAVIASNNTSGNDTLNLAAGTYTLTIAGVGEDGSATGDIDVQTNITIAGAGMASTIISGGGIDRAIEVDGSGNLTLSDVRLTGGSINNDGGALLVEEAGGVATLTRVDITGNTITGGGRIGGGIHNVGTLSLTDSLVHGNTATGSDGGGISNLGTATLTRSSIYANSARYGGGIHQLAGSMAIENLTLSGNTASAEGGGIDVAAGALTVKFTTVAANTASGGNGGGAMVRAGTLTIGSSIFADNMSASGGRDLHGAITSLGYNVIEHNAGFSGTVATDLLGSDPALAALALDAASGQYLHALGAGSIAIDLGGVAPPPTDQRNAARDGSADAGAYERLNSAPVLDASGTMTFTSITEDDVNNAGNLVSALIASAGGDRITDADGDPEGIAITATADGNGSWEYSIDGGGSWYTIGTVTNASALLLRSSDRVRFVPNANDGTTASITFRAWDRKVGTEGTKVSTASNGGSSAFSVATESASIVVNAVNDAPVNTAPSGQFTALDASLVFSAANGNQISVSDVDAGANPIQVSLTVGHGTLTLAGTAGLSFTSGANGSATMTFTGTVSAVNTALNGLTYAPTIAYRGLDSLQIVTNDQGNAGSGGALSDSDTVKLYDGALVVTNTNDLANGTTTSISALVASDGGDGISLREAMIAANSTAGADYVYFDIAGGGPHMIDVVSALPTITDAIVIDASSEPDFAGNGGKPIVVLDGNDLAADGLVLASTADGSTIRALVIRDFGGDGIEILAGSDGNTIAGNYLGRLDTSGADAGVAESNAGSGLAISGANNTIGGTSAADRNVISGNSGHGVFIISATATGNLVQGNYVGTNAAGTAAVGNAVHGIALSGGASNNLIGGTSAGARNVISGNAIAGVRLAVASTSGNTIQGNFIGVDVSGAVALGNGSFGVITDSQNTTIGGTAVGARNVISGNASHGVQVDDEGTGAVIQGNYIGTDVTGTLGLGNAGAGIYLNATTNVVIGAGARNVIAGNTNAGIYVNAGSGHTIQGNYIGVDASGAADLGNGWHGVFVNNGAGNLIGGTTAAERNVISGNAAYGVAITGAASTGNTVSANYIGLDAAGTAAIGNVFGVDIEGGATSNVIGGLTASERNVISGNSDSGVLIQHAGTSGNQVLGNYIGTNAAGSAAVANLLSGVNIKNGAIDNTVGGTADGAGNLISGNGGPGVVVGTAGTTGNAVLRNSIVGNTGLGIDIDGDGVTANDPVANMDSDSGANNLQNFPVLSSARVLSGSQIQLAGTINSTAGSFLRIEFFSSPAQDASGYGEGQTYLGFVNVTTDASGNASFNATLTASVAAGSSISATATRSNAAFTTFADTSEFARSVVALSQGIRVTPVSVVPLGTETRVNTNTVNIQTINSNVAQAIAVDANGNYVVVWASNLQDGSSYGIYAQLFSADGAAQGSEFLVNTTTADNQINPAVAMDAAGNFVVTWSSNLQDGSGYGIYAQRFDAAGVAQGSDFRVNATTAASQSGPAIAMAPSGAFVIAWTGGGQDPDGSSGIYAQRFDASGVAQGGEFRVNTYTTNTQQLTSVAIDGAGNFVVTWASLNQDDGASYGVYGQRYNAAGVAQGAEFRVNTTIADSQLYHDVAMLADGRFAVVFQSRSAGAYEVYVQRYAADGTAIGGETRVNTTTVTVYQPIPSISADPSGNLTVVWRSPADGSGDGVIGRRFDWSGTPLGAEFQVNTTSTGDQGYPEVVSQAGGGFIVAWSGNGPGDADGVFFQRYGLTTTEAGGTATFSVVLEAAPTADVVVPISVPDATEGMVLVGSLTFTTANWNIAQIVTVTGVQDYSNDGNVAYTVVLGNATSTDLNFNGLNPADLSVTNLEVPNVAPVNMVPGAQSVNEGTALVFSAANGNAITLGDTDAGANALQVTLSVTNGMLTLGGVSGLSFSSGANGSATMTFSGTISNINTALNGLRFDPTANFNGSAVLTLMTNDQGNSGTGGAQSDSDTVAITVNAVNDPAVVATTGSTLAYTENGAATAIDTGLAVSDVDSTNLAGATVTISANYANGQDVLAFTDQNGISGSWNAAAGVLTLSGSATVANYQTALRSVTYLNSSDDPSTATRTVSFVVSDGAANSNTATRDIGVTAVNDAPVAVTSAGSLNYNENAAATPIDPALTVSDIDGATLSGATVRISVAYANGQDILGFTNQLGISGSWNAASGTLTLSGSASVADYQTALRSVTFVNTSENPSLAVRTVEFIASDGAASSTPATREVSVTNIDDAPTTNDASVSADEDASSIAITLTGSDVDGTVDRFRLTTLPANGTLYLDAGLTSAAATGTDYNASGQSLTLYFRPNPNWNGVTSFQFAARDAVGMIDATPATATITVSAVNDAPTGAPVVTGSAAEDQTLGVDTSSIADADGLGAFSYQWQRDGTAIGGATGSTYTLGDADVGANIHVVVSYTDGSGTAESLTSAAVGPVANVNDAPTGAPVVTGTPTEDQTLAADTSSIADADGLGTFSYQWQRNGSNIAAATASTYLLGDADVGANIRVVVSYIDARGTAESLTSAAVGPVANVNDAPSGAPVVTGTVTEDQTLTADTSSIADADGLGAFSYQWQRNGSNIAGATASTYALGDADVGANIRVVVSYTDGGGTTESLTSAAVGPVANVNDAPSGAPAVTGTPTEDQTLSADTSTIADADGLGVFSYQWQRNGVNIAGATASNYTLGDADVGTNIRVVVSYTDARGTAESLTSASVGPVANVNDAPSGAPVVTGTATEDQTLTADTSGIADADGLGAFGYQWQRDGVNIVGATASTYTLGDADVGTSIRVVVSYTDGNGTAESLTSVAVGPIANVNDAPSGAPVVTGTPTENQTLTADTSSIADADGLGAFSYQWQRNGVNIAGATASTYALGDADVGTNIRVVVGYTDGQGTAESLTSAAVGPVANVNDAPSGVPVVTGTASEDQTLTADTSGIADADGLGAFSWQWQRNGSNIAGATGSTYLLGDADVGTNIRVVVSYTDGNGTAESLSSAAVGPIANVNDAPSGAPVVTGAATEDQTLTADTSGIADADGLGAFSWQWQRNGSNIAGATASTYTLGDADVGTSIRVVVSYTDGNGTAESLTSAAVGPIANVNDAPSGAPAVTGTPTEDQTLSADTSSIADADGLGAFSYQWQRNGSAIAGATSSTYTLGDADVGTSIRVVVSYTDGNGAAENLTSAAVGPIANVNDVPSGAPVVTGTATEDQTLTADISTIADADGLGAFSYQWQRDGANIAGATSSTYTLGDADVGTSIRVVVSYTDGQGTAESLTSAAVGPIANVNDAPTVTSDGGNATAALGVAENQTAVTTVTSSDVDGGAPAYTVIGGADAARFAIDPASGVLRFIAAPDFEAAVDFDGDNVYEVTVQVADGNGGFATQAIAVTVSDANDAPIIVSDGGGATASLTVGENQSAVTTVASSDVDGAAPVFSIVGGADAALFTIDAASGALRFIGSKDFEAPADADRDNVYRVTVQVADGNGGVDTQAIAVRVTDVNEAPSITSLGGGPAASVSLAENQTAVAVLIAADPDGDAPRWRIVGGADAARFAIDANSGALRFVAAPDFEAAVDADADNVYELMVGVDDGRGGSDWQAISVAVNGVNEAPLLAAPAAVELVENAAAGTLVASVTASDPDAGDLFSFSLVADGGGRFMLDAASGQLLVAPGATLDFEAAGSHTLLLRVTDAQGVSTEQAIVVTLRDSFEGGSSLPPDTTPPPAPAPAPAPAAAPAPAQEAAPPVEGGREVAGSRGERTSSDEPAHGALVAGALNGQDNDSANADTLLQRTRAQREDGPLLVASVSFLPSGMTGSEWSAQSLDELLLHSASDNANPRPGWPLLRGAALDTGAVEDSERGAHDNPSQQVVAALQDPVRVASATLTAGFVWWLTRSGGLLTSILMGIPAWRHVDLLPVLAPRRDDDEEEDALDSRHGDDSADSERHSLVDELFSNTSRLFGESRYLP